MNYLARNRLLVRWNTALNFGITVLVLAVIAALEILGRTVQTDLQDAVYLLVLLSLSLGLVGWHRRRPLGWVTFFVTGTRRLWATLRTRSYEQGLDFRGTPTYTQRWPAPFAGFVCLCLFLSAVAVIAAYSDLKSWRQPVIQFSYTIYLGLLLLHWITLLVLLVLGIALPLLRLDHWLKQERETRERRTMEFFAGLVLLTLICCASKWLPTAIPLGFLLLSLLVVLVVLLLPSRDGLSVLWRRVNHHSFYSIPLHRVIAALAGCILLLAVTQILIGRAGQLLTSPSDADPLSLSATMAGLAAWALPGAVIVVMLRVVDEYRHDPARRTPPTVHYRSTMSLELDRAMRTGIQRNGWQQRSPSEPPQRGDIRLEVVPPEESLATEFQPNWPLKLHPADLSNPDVIYRLNRHDVIQLRRRFTKTLHRIFKHLAGSKAMARGGCWFAPHWWFISGLGIEASSRRRSGIKPSRRALRRFGPTYQTLFGARVRQHLHEVFRAVQLDMIYIEAGVSSKSVVAVLRQVFEVHDIHGGQRILDDHSFTGVPKVRVTIHELVPSLAKPGSYDDLNPKFDELSRGRILHIFRDKGEFEDVDTTPKDFDYVPSPSLIGS